MRPLAELEATDAIGLRVLLTDIDGTLTDAAGRIPSSVFAAMEDARAAGLAVVPVTGRPAGWCDLIARTWPVDAVVGENGAFFVVREAGVPHFVHVQDAEERRRNRARLAVLGEEVLRRFPGTALASDQGYRLHDLAIDFCEDVPARPWEEVDAIAAFLRAEGCAVKISSIHVNAWFGDFDKATTCASLLSRRFGLGGAEVRRASCYFGDSPNDAPLFAAVDHGIGVANVRDFDGRMEHWPRWITAGRSDLGFVEGVGTLLHLRTQALRG